jgi:hypothetical protein
MAGQSGYDTLDRTTKIGQPGQVNLDWSPWTGEPGQNREDKPEQDSNDRTIPSEELMTRLLGQDSWHTQLVQDSWDTIARRGQPRQDSQRKHSGYYVQDRIKKTRQPAHVSKNRAARTGQGDGTTMAAQLA